jgi:phosphate transport system substrate-binding protein
MVAAALVLLGLVGFALWFFLGRGGGGTDGPTPPSATATNGTATGSSQAGAAAGDLLRLSGSNTIGERLAPALAEAFLTEQGARDVQRVSGADPNEVSVVGTLPGQSGPQAIRIAAHGSSTAFTDLEGGKADVGMASRRIKEEEKAKLSRLGDLTSRASEHVLGLDGLAVVVHPANPVDSLTADQVRRLFTGEVTDWSQVGGSGGPLVLYARDDKSGTFDTFKHLILRDQPLASDARRYENSEELSDGVAGDPRGIGFIGLPFVRSAKALKISEGNTLAMRPNRLTVRTEDYLLSRRLYLYTAEAPESPWVRKFVEFALSDAGQAVVDREGFVGQALADEPTATVADLPAPAGDLPPEYARLTQGSERLSFNFRFQTGSAELDNKANRDLGRLVQLMSGATYQGRELLLFGFADARGSEGANLALSEQRARAVTQALTSEGISAGVTRGFGEALPVASNDSEEGREKNRRVEVWVRR